MTQPGPNVEITLEKNRIRWRVPTTTTLLARRGHLMLGRRGLLVKNNPPQPLGRENLVPAAMAKTLTMR